jgi:hypothetical protein
MYDRHYASVVDEAKRMARDPRDLERCRSTLHSIVLARVERERPCGNGANLLSRGRQKLSQPQRFVHPFGGRTSA